MWKIHLPPPINPEKDITTIVSLLHGNTNSKEINAFLEEHEHEKYYHWDKFRRIPLPPWYTHDDFWKVIKFQRWRWVKIQLLDHQFFFRIPNFLTKKLHYIDLHMWGSLSGTDLIPRGDEIKYLHSSLIEESIASSQIEWAATTREVARDMILSERAPRTHDEKMILNNYRAMQFISRSRWKKLDMEVILNLHQILTQGTLKYGNDEWRFRISDDIRVVDSTTGETLHIPPKYTEIPWLMDEFLEFFNTHSEKTFIHPIVKGIIFHFLIWWIHPFADGNGRTARGLYYWYIMNNGYWLTEYISISRMIKRSTTDYKNAYLYTETDDNDLTYFIDYNIGCLMDWLDSFKEYIHNQITKQKILKDTILETGINHRQIQILAWLSENHRIVTIQQTANTFLVTVPSTRLDLEWLVKNWKLKKVPLNKKTYGYTIP